MDVRPALISQYYAALEMLKQTILACPDPVWFDPADVNKFSQVCYHSLFYIHLYLSDSVTSFQPWSKHRDEYRLAGGGESEPIHPASKTLVLEYLEFCRDEIATRLAVTDLDAPSGFDWLPFNKFELQVYTIRHIQHHVGELMERLYARAHIELDWVGSIPPGS